MPIMDHFGIIAPFYDRVFKPKKRDYLFELLDNMPVGFLLDAGGGTGRISQFFRHQASTIIIADLSFEMLLQAKSKTGLNLVCTHTEGLPFPDGIFDRIIMIDALHHVCDQAETVKELYRLLKPGGRIIIEEPDINKLGIKILAVVEKVLGMRSYFIPPLKIASLFSAGKITIKSKGLIAWVVADKEIFIH